MAYFDCIVGGSGKGNTVTVTCAEEFAGLTITLSKTGKTYTKTCPSTAPYVVTFNGVENGTYIVSCTVDGETYSETVIVQDISCVLNYGFKWQTWVDTASQLDSTDYNSLDEVLADEEAVRELFLEHACVDYMAEATSSNADLETIINDDYCAKWINNSDYALDFLGANTVIKALMDEADKYGYGEWVITDNTTTPPTWGAKGNVPVMTANNAPYGVASASTTYDSSWAPWKAFDGVVNNPDDAWSTTHNHTSNQYLRYAFPNPVSVNEVEVQSHAIYCAKNCKIQYSNDGTTWNDAKEFTIERSDAINKIKLTTPITARYWGLYIVDSYTVEYTYIRHLQFYGRELKVSVPTMTSNTAPYGKAIKTTNTFQDPYKAFDTDTSSYVSANSNQTGFGVGYEFGYPIKLVRAVVTMHCTYNKTFNNFIIQGSNDNSVWVDISSKFTMSGSNNSIFNIDINANALPYKMYRVYNGEDVINVSGSYDMGVATLQFYGLDYSEKEFEVGATKKWLYDHGVELVELEEYSTGGTITKENNSIVMVTPSDKSQFIGKVLDLTTYNLARMALGNKGATISQYSGLICRESASGGTTVAVQRFATNTNFPNNIGIDISSVLQTLFIGVSSAGNTMVDIAELWLE